MKIVKSWGLALFMMVGAYLSADACTRVVYEGPNKTILTGRSMDWSSELDSDLWVFPRGMKRNGVAGENSVEWVSKYGSIITSAYNVASTDGMNEQGLVANLLWLAESQYPKRDYKEKGLSIAAWLQFVLDNFATVDEAVTYMQGNNIQVVTDMVPGQARLANLHLSISDATGDNAIFEYLDGKLNIHHDRSYQVMTNSPSYDQQLTLDDYWKSISGLVFLPGTNRAVDRFVRASYYINVIPQVDDQRISTASVFSVIRNVSVPFGISTPNEPNISSTRWRTVSDQKNKIYYFESTLYPNIVWVDFKDIDFSEKASVKVLNLAKGQVYDGDVAQKFVESQPFEFLSPKLN